MSRILVGTATVWIGLLAAQAYGKGLDDIKATADTTPPPASGATPVEEAKPQEPAAAAAGAPPAGEKPAEAAPAETAPLEKSALSKKLENKLYLAPAMNLGTITGDSGDWSSAANGSIEAGWLVSEKMPRNGRLYATARYCPYDVVVARNSQSFRGVVEGWYFGAQSVMPWNEKMHITGGAELGYMVVHMNPADSYDVKESDEKGGVSVNLSGGAEWKMLDKLLVGPKLGLGFGTFKTVQLGAKATFFF